MNNKGFRKIVLGIMAGALALSAAAAVFSGCNSSSSSDKHGGYDISVGPWLKQRGVSIVGSDTIQDVSTVEGLVLPLHHYILVALGANIVDNADLEKAVETARRLKQWEFMLVALPVPVPGGSGFPINPLAIF